MNSATYLVSPGAFGNSAAGTGDAYKRPRPSANAETAREFLNKSRRFITARLQVIKSRVLEYYALFYLWTRRFWLVFTVEGKRFLPQSVASSGFPSVLKYPQ